MKEVSSHLRKYFWAKILGEMIAHYKLALVLVNWKPGLLTLLNVRRGADQGVSFDLRFLTYCNVKKGVWVLKEKMKFNIAKKNYKMGNNGRLSNKVQIFPVLHIMEVTFFSSYMYYTRVSEGDNLKKRASCM